MRGRGHQLKRAATLAALLLEGQNTPALGRDIVPLCKTVSPALRAGPPQHRR